MRHWIVLRAAVMATGVVMLGGCGDDVADPGPGDAGGTVNTCLQGTWDCTLPDTSTAEMTITGNALSGSFTESGITLTVASTLSVDGNTLTVTDTGGTGGCPSAQVGQYNFTCDSTALSFARVTDLCLGRSNFFGCSWTRR